MCKEPKQKGIFLSINGQQLYKDNFLANFTELLSENVDTIIRTIETDVNNAVKQIVNLYQKACLFMKKNNSCNFKNQATCVVG